MACAGFDLVGWGSIAAYLDVSEATAKRYARFHGLPVVRVVGRVMAKSRKVERWIEKQ